MVRGIRVGSHVTLPDGQLGLVVGLEYSLDLAGWLRDRRRCYAIVEHADGHRRVYWITELKPA